MDNLTYHQVSNLTSNKTSSSTSTASSMSSTNVGNSNQNISAFPVNSLEKPLNSLDFVTVNNEQIRLDKLPSNIRFELDQLELELLEGDLTQKGFDKKKGKLLAPYMSHDQKMTTMSSTSTITINTPKFMSKLNYELQF